MIRDEEHEADGADSCSPLNLRLSRGVAITTGLDVSSYLHR
jgi:hypothetical protein